MKRSEFITYVVVNGPEIGLNLDPFSSRETIEKILLLAEKIGMAPPAIKEPCESYVLYNGKHVRVEDSFIFTHKWDEE